MVTHGAEFLGNSYLLSTRKRSCTFSMGREGVVTCVLLMAGIIIMLLIKQNSWVPL